MNRLNAMEYLKGLKKLAISKGYSVNPGYVKLSKVMDYINNNTSALEDEHKYINTIKDCELYEELGESEFLRMKWEKRVVNNSKK